MDKTTFVGCKGGVGTSTVAVMHALSVAEAGRSVRLTATGPGGIDDLAAILAVPTPAPAEVIEIAAGLSLGDEADPSAYTVVDGGTDTFPDHSGRVYLVCATLSALFARGTARSGTSVADESSSFWHHGCMATSREASVEHWTLRAVALVIAASFLHTGRELGLATRLPVVLLAAVSVWLTMDLADNRSSLHDQSWAWLSPRLVSPYVTFASLLTLIGAQETSLGVAIVSALAFAALMPGPIVVAMILRVRRDRPSQRA